MSTLSGIAGKGDRSKAKFKALDINNVYKGTSVAPQKTAGELDRVQHYQLVLILLHCWQFFTGFKKPGFFKQKTIQVLFLGFFGQSGKNR